MIMEAEKERTVRFVPSDKVNLFTVTTLVTVPLVDPPAPVRITYTQPSGGTLTVTCEADGKPLPSGTLVVAGTEIRIQAVAVDYFALESLCIGTADFTADAINGNGTVVHAMYSSWKSAPPSSVLLIRPIPIFRTTRMTRTILIIPTLPTLPIIRILLMSLRCLIIRPYHMGTYDRPGICFSGDRQSESRQRSFV